MRRILVRAPNWMGDVVLSLAAVRDLRRNFPSARIEVLARPAVADLYRAVAEVDGLRESAGTLADVPGLRGAFDLGLVLPNSLGAALSLALAGIPERWGYATDGRRALLTRAAAVPAAVRGESEVYYYRAMLAGVGLKVSAAPDVSLQVPASWRARGRALLGNGGEWLGLSPGASFGTAKRWIPERFAALADEIARHRGLRPVLLGSRAEWPLAERVAAAMRTSPLVLTGRTSLPELAGVVAELRVLVTNDSGPMHLAAALGTPLVALFGPTDWRETAPVSDRARIVREPVSCSPCKLRECPIDHRCMTRITVERVMRETEEALAWT